MGTQPQERNLQAEISAAQLQKLKLEISSLNTEKEIKEKTADHVHDKLLLEVTSLRRQNGLLAQATQFATVVTILATLITMFATVFGLWVAYDKFVTDKQKDRDLKKKEVTEEASKQYRAELQQLLLYPVDGKQTIPAAVFLLRDIQAIIEGGYEGDELVKRRNEVGVLLTQLAKSPEFDLGEIRNSEFDRKAMNHCPYYPDYLVKAPSENMDIISKYKDVLVSISKIDPEYVEGISLKPDNIFVEGKQPRTPLLKSQLISLFHGYNKHIELLARNSNENPLNLRIKKDLNLSFCWFYGATNNKDLTVHFFGGDLNGVQRLWDTLCK